MEKMRLNMTFVLVLLSTKFSLMPCSITNITVATIIQKNVWPHVEMENSMLKSEDLTMFKVTVFAESNFRYIVDKACSLTNENVHGFIFYTDCNGVIILDKIELLTHVPSIVITRDLCDLESEHTIQLQPSCKRSNALIANLAFNRRWRNVLLIFDETLNQRCMTDLISRLSLNPTSTRLVYINNYNSAEAYLGFLSKYHPDAVVLVASKEAIATTLNEAANANIKNYKWILMTGDPVLPRLNHTFFQDELILFISHKSRLEDVNIYHDSIDRSVLGNKYHDEAVLWMFDLCSKIVSSKNLSSLEPLTCRKLPKVAYRDNIVNMAKQIDTLDPNEYQLSSVKSVNKRIKWVNQGVWSKTTGFHLTDEKMFANEFKDFGYATLKVATDQSLPFVFSEKDNLNNKTIYSGFCIDVLDELASRFKFRYELVEPPDHQFGSLEEDGTWTGMVGMTQRKEVDFAVGPFTITSAREEVIDFTTTFSEIAVGILTLRPHSEANKEYKVFKPLTVEVWGLIGAAVVLVGAMFYAVNKLSPYSNVEGENKTENKLDLSTSFWLIYGTLFELDVPGYRPKSCSGRVMLGLWWIFIILMLAAYTAQLAAYLTVSIVEPPINSLDELADQNKIKPLYLDGTNLEDLFETGTSPTYKKMFDKTNDMPRIYTDREALAYVKSGSYAFMRDDSTLDYFMHQDCTTFVLAEEKFDKAGLGFVLQENAKYLKAFNFAIMKMAEGGLIERWRNKWLLQGDTCKTKHVMGSAQSLDMDSLLGLFYVYLGAIGISTVVFVIEVICRTKQMRKTRNKLADRLRAVRGSLNNQRVFTPNVGET